VNVPSPNASHAGRERPSSQEHVGYFIVDNVGGLVSGSDLVNSRGSTVD